MTLRHSIEAFSLMFRLHNLKHEELQRICRRLRKIISLLVLCVVMGCVHASTTKLSDSNVNWENRCSYDPAYLIETALPRI